ncbi:MAG: leucyl aminopeptidase, partial [Deltaproteobacteria bacterium]|nr:leucyl aminopeptidase [Deltaproteobacteria bacterium]
MEVKVISGDIIKLDADAAVVNLFEGDKRLDGATESVDKALGGAITRLIDDGEIKGKQGEIILIHTLGMIKPTRIVVVGLGKEEKFTPDTIRVVSAEVCRFLRKIGAKRVATIAHGVGVGGIEPEKVAQALAEGGILGLYTFRKHVTREPEYGEIEEVLIIEQDDSKLAALEQGIDRGQVLAEAANFARDMVNEPANCM